MSMHTCHPKPISRQRGAALFTGLVLLLVLTIVALAASRSTIMQEKMTANIRESNEAFQRAEDVIRQVETRIRIANENGTVPSVTLESWGSSPYLLADCAGAELLEDSDPTGANWSDAPERPSGATMRYRVLEMVALTAGLPCRPDEGLQPGLPQRSSYYLIVAYAEGPAGRGSATATSTYFYDLGT